ncbi:MAG: hypothetical protein JJU10_00890 [Idiomarina sp.]|nr:hypothetical protein [Idiomarina sp.]
MGNHSMGNLRLISIVSLTALLGLTACSGPDAEEQLEPSGPSMSEPHAEFFAALQTLCGKAFAGERIVARNDDRELLQGNEALVVHFRECTDTQIFAPFHIERPADGDWDRSRTWIYTLHAERLEINHDHRTPSGEPDELTFYGGYTVEPGSAERQMFIFTERTGEEGEVLGWRIEIQLGERYTYGTMADGDWTWRLDFDLTSHIEPPPAPWGHE